MPAGFHEVVFPTDISWGATGGPGYSTTVVMSDSGFEQRNINWVEARMQWNVTHGIKTDEQLQELITFFRARKGKAYGFLFKDWADFQVESQTTPKISGQTNKYQLRKEYVDTARTEVRNITKPIAATLVVLDGVTPLVQGVDYTVDTTTGIITTTDDPGPTNLTCTFEFYVPVRFDTDIMKMSLDFYNASNWDDIAVVELRV